MKQNRSWILIVGLLGLAGTHCSTESSETTPTSSADAVALYEQALSDAKVPLAAAIAAAAAKYPAGTFESAKFDAEAAAPAFEVDIAVGDTVLEARIDSGTGEVASWGPDDDAADEAATGEGQAPEADEACDREGRVPREQAIASAEAASGGRAVEMSDDGCCFGVRVFGDGEFHDVDVDGRGNAGQIRRVDWAGRKRGPRPSQGSNPAAAGADGAGPPGGPGQGQGGDDGAGPRGGRPGDGPWQGQGGSAG